MFIFLYCFVRQYQLSDWPWRPPPKWTIVCRVGRWTLFTHSKKLWKLFVLLCCRSWRHTCICLCYW